jgi:YidC/Oxa1 family membrane protein insertase
MDRNTVIAIILTFLLVFLYLNFLAPKRKPQQPVTVTVTNITGTATTDVSAVTTEDKPPAADTNIPAQEITGLRDATPVVSGIVPQYTMLTNNLVSYTFSSLGGDIYRIELAKTAVVRKGPVITTIAPSNNWQVPLRFQEIGDIDAGSLVMSPASIGSTEITFTGLLENTFLVTKRYMLEPDSYLLRSSVTLKNITGEPVQLDKGLTVWLGQIDRATQTRDRFSAREVDVSVIKNDNGGRDIKRVKENKKDDIKVIAGPAEWLDIRNKYFTHIMVPENDAASVKAWSLGMKGAREITAAAVFACQPVEPGASLTWNATLYAGPKQYERLKILGTKIGKGSNYLEIMDFGWFAFLAKPILLYGLKGLYKYVHNYGVAIIILTVLIKLLTWPLTSKSVTSMKQMEKIQPEMKALREQYKDNPQKLNQEMMLLYRKHGYNPLSGCLPMFLQLPIFIALYSALSRAIELHGASFLWIKDLSMPDEIARLPYIPFFGNKMLGYTGVHPLAIAMGLAMIGQQLLSPKTGDASQRRMMLLMPAIFIVIFYNMPSGLVLYWFVNQLLTMGQMFYLHYIKK